MPSALASMGDISASELVSKSVEFFPSKLSIKEQAEISKILSSVHNPRADDDDDR